MEFERKMTQELSRRVDGFRRNYQDIAKENYPLLRKRTQKRVVEVNRARGKAVTQDAKVAAELEYWRAKRQELIAILSSYESHDALTISSFTQIYLDEIYDDVRYIAQNINWKAVFKPLYECFGELDWNKCKDFQGMLRNFALEAIEKTWKKNFIDTAKSELQVTDKIAASLWNDYVIVDLKKSDFQELVEKGVESLNSKGEEKLAEFMEKKILEQLSGDKLVGKSKEALDKTIKEQAEETAKSNAKVIFAAPAFASDLFWKFVTIYDGLTLVEQMRPQVTTYMKWVREASECSNAGDTKCAPKLDSWYFGERKALMAQIKLVRNAKKTPIAAAKPGRPKPRDGGVRTADEIEEDLAQQEKAIEQHGNWDGSVYRNMMERAHGATVAGEFFAEHGSKLIRSARAHAGRDMDIWRQLSDPKPEAIERAGKQLRELTENSNKLLKSIFDKENKAKKGLEEIYFDFLDRDQQLVAGQTGAYSKIDTPLGTCTSYLDCFALLNRAASQGRAETFQSIKENIVQMIELDKAWRDRRVELHMAQIRKEASYMCQSNNRLAFWEGEELRRSHGYSSRLLSYHGCDPIGSDVVRSVAEEHVNSVFSFRDLAKLEDAEGVLERAIARQAVYPQQPIDTEYQDELESGLRRNLAGTALAAGVGDEAQALQQWLETIDGQIGVTAAALRKALDRAGSDSFQEKANRQALDSYSELACAITRGEVGKVKVEGRLSTIRTSYERLMVRRTAVSHFTEDLGLLTHKVHFSLDSSAERLRRLGEIMGDNSMVVTAARVVQNRDSARQLLDQAFKSLESSYPQCADYNPALCFSTLNREKARQMAYLFPPPAGSGLVYNCSTSPGREICFSVTRGGLVDFKVAEEVLRDLVRVRRENQKRIDEQCDLVDELTRLAQGGGADQASLQQRVDFLLQPLSLQASPTGTKFGLCTHDQLGCDLDAAINAAWDTSDPPSEGVMSELQVVLDLAPGIKQSQLRVRITDQRGNLIIEGFGPHKLAAGKYIVDVVGMYLETEPRYGHIVLEGGKKTIHRVRVWQDDEEKDDDPPHTGGGAGDPDVTGGNQPPQNGQGTTDTATLYSQYIAAYNKLTYLMSHGQGDTPAAQEAYKQYKKFKDAYEKAEQGKENEPPPKNDNGNGPGAQQSGTGTIIPQRMQLSPVADAGVYAYSYRNWHRANIGKQTTLGTGRHPSGGEKRSFLKFEIPQADPARLQRATLKLYQYHLAGANLLDLAVYKVTGSWLEGLDTYHSGQVEKDAASGELSWVQQPSFAGEAITSVNPGSSTKNWLEFDITPLVRQWLAGEPNHGLVVKISGNSPTRSGESMYGFISREHADTAKHPVLELTFGGDNGAVNGGSNDSVTIPGNQVYHFTSGVYRVDVRTGNRMYSSTWTLTGNNSTVHGESQWTCCPGPRLDPMIGTFKGDTLSLERDCRGQGYNQPCKQIYTGTIKDNHIEGVFTHNGAYAGTWILFLQSNGFD